MNRLLGAKRIGLLFSSAKIDCQLDPRWTEDIPDLKSGPNGDEVFSDGCGLVSKKLAMQLARQKKIIFRGARYVPTVYQIRFVSPSIASFFCILIGLSLDIADTKVF
jgi:hypothetical protein